MRGFRRKCGVNWLTATVDETVNETYYYGDGTFGETISGLRRGDLPVYWPRVRTILLGDSSYYVAKDYKSKNKTGF